MSKLLRVLTAERENLARQLAAIDGAISALGGPGAAAPMRIGPRRARKGEAAADGFRTGSLKSYLVRSLTGEMGPTELAEAVMKAGYQTKNKTLEKSVGIALAKLAADNHVRKVGRGRFVRA